MMLAHAGDEVWPIRSTGSVVLRDGYEAHVMRRALERYATNGLDADTALALAARVAPIEAALAFGGLEADAGLFALVGATS